MPRPLDGNEPHFIPRPVIRDGPAVVGSGSVAGQVYSPYDLTEICDKGFDSRVIGRLIMATLTTHFSDADRIAYEDVKQYVWVPDPVQTNIRIALNTKWDPVQAGKAPSIIVQRGDLNVERVAIGDFARIEGGAAIYTRQAKGSYSINIFAQTDGLLEQLTDEVFFMLNAQFTFLREHWPIHQIEVLGMSGPKPVEKADHWLAASVVVGVEFEFGWAYCRDPAELQALSVVNAAT